MEKEKILFVLPRMGGGGAERIAALLANSLVDKHNVSLLTFVGGPSFYPLRSEVNYMPGNGHINRRNIISSFWSQLVSLPRIFWFLFRTLRQNHYTTVISFLPEADLLVFVCRKFVRHFNHICSERNDPTCRNLFWRWILPQIYKSSQGFVCQSRTVADYYQTVPQTIKTIIPNFVDISALPVPSSFHTERIVSVGRLFPQKNFSLLINSFASICPQFPQYRLDIYGEGPLRSVLQRQINLLGLADKITLRGQSSHVLREIADAALFVLCSNYEGFPNVLLEAMGMGLPVISTDFRTGVARELLDSTCIVPVGDENALAQTMTKLLSDLRRRMHIHATNRHRVQQYDISKIQTQWEQVILKLTDNYIG